MAISDGTAGDWVATTTRNPSVTLPSHAAGDMLLVRMGWKSATPTTDVAACGTSGWAKVGQYYNSGGASSNGGGGVLVAVFWKVATSSSETSPTIQFDDATAPTPGAYCAVTYTKGSSETWDTPVGDGGPIAAATSYSGTIQSHVTAASGDMLDAFAVICDNNVMTSPTVAQTGLTLDTVTEYPATALNSGTSNDISADGCNRLATAGTSSAAAVVSGSQNASDAGAAWVTRLRLAPSDTAPAELASGSGTSYGATITATTAAGLATTATGTAYAAQGGVGALTGLAEGSGTAYDATVDIYEPAADTAPAELAEASGTSHDPSAAITVNAGGIGGASYAATIIADSPIAYWRLGEADGTTANDEIGTADLTYYNTPTLGTAGAIVGDADTAVTFNGSDEYAYAASNAAWSAATTGYLAVEAWVYFGGSGAENGIIAGRGNWGTGWEWQLSTQPYDNTTWFTLKTWLTDASNSGNDVSFDAGSYLSGWHHVVGIIRSGGALSLYLDGEAATDTDTCATITASTSPLTVGRMGDGTQYLEAGVDEVAIYDSALTAEQVAAHYAAGTNAATGAVGAAYNATPAVGGLAGLAEGTGAAYDATIAATTSAGLAEGSGAAYDATTAVQASAGLAEGSGAAYDATVDTFAPESDTAPAELAEASGAALDVAAAVGPTAGIAEALGAAHDAQAGTTTTAGLAEATGAAADAAIAIGGSGGLSAASGAAYDATITSASQPTAGLAEGTGAAADAQVAIGSPAETAPGSGAAYDASIASQPTAGLAEAAGAAYDATVQTGELGTDTAPAELAAATGAAQAASVAATTNAGAAAAIGAAFDASGAVGAYVGHASATGTAYDATILIAGGIVDAEAGLAGAIGRAFNATILTSGEPAPRPPSGRKPRPEDFAAPLDIRSDDEDVLLAWAA